MATISEFINKIGFKVKENDVNKVNNTMQGIKDTASKILGVIGIGFSLSAINGLVEEFTRVKDQVKNSTAGLEEQADIQKKILGAASVTRSEYAKTADIVSKLVKENSELFGNIDEAIKFHNAATMLFKTAGKSNDEIAGLMEAINKSFAKGKIDSETLNQLLERSPEAVQLLNKRLGTTTDQLEKLAADGKISLNDLKGAFVDNAAEIEASFKNVKMTVSDAITVIRNKWGLWLADTNEMLGLTDTIGRTMVNSFDSAMRVITKVRTGLVWLAEKLGGTQNLLRLIAIVAGSIFLATNFSKIMSGLSSIGKMLSGINLKMLAIIAAIVLVALVAEDFINFMQGNNSLLGSMLEQAGVDCDDLRETITSSWDEIKGKLAVVWDHMATAGGSVWIAIQKMASAIGEGLRAFWSKWGGDITATLSVVWNSVKVIFDNVLAILIGVADFIGAVFKGDWDAAWQAIKDIFFAWVNAVIAYLGAFISTMKLKIKVGLDFIKGLFVAIWSGIKTVTSTVWNAIKTVILNVWNGIIGAVSNAINKVRDSITNIWGSIKSATSSAWNGIKSAILNPINSAWTAVKNIVDKLKKAFNFSWSLPKLKLPHITVTGGIAPYGIGGRGSLPKFDIQWYRKGGILDGAQIFGAMGNKLLGGGEAGKEAVLPLTELWKNMRAIIRSGVTDLVKIIKPMTGIERVSSTTVSTATNSYVSRSIVQNIEFNNEFHGDTAVQKNAAKTMKQAAKDTTAELARGLAFTG